MHPHGKDAAVIAVNLANPSAMIRKLLSREDTRPFMCRNMKKRHVHVLGAMCALLRRRFDLITHDSTNEMSVLSPTSYNPKAGRP